MRAANARRRTRCGLSGARQPGDAVAGHRDERGGNERDAGAGQPRAHAEVEALVGAGERRVEAAELAPRVGAHEQAAHIGAEHVLDGVVLALVELAVGEADRAAEARHR